MYTVGYASTRLPRVPKRCRGEAYLGVLAPVSVMFARQGTEYSVHLLDTPAVAHAFKDEVMAQPALVKAFQQDRVTSTVFRRTTLIAYNTTGAIRATPAAGRRPHCA